MMKIQVLASLILAAAGLAVCRAEPILIDNEDHFNQTLTDAEDKLVVVLFSAKWCRRCKTIEPELESMKKQHKAELVVLKVDVEEPVTEPVTKRYKINIVPSFVLIRKKEMLAKVLENDNQAVKNKIYKHIGEHADTDGSANDSSATNTLQPQPLASIDASQLKGLQKRKRHGFRKWVALGE